MAVTMQKTKATKVYNQEEIKSSNPSLHNESLEPKIELKTPIQLNAAMGLGIGGNELMSKPQTLDQNTPLKQTESIPLSERDLLKILKEE